MKFNNSGYLDTFDLSWVQCSLERGGDLVIHPSQQFQNPFVPLDDENAKVIPIPINVAQFCYGPRIPYMRTYVVSRI